MSWVSNYNIMITNDYIRLAAQYDSMITNDYIRLAVDCLQALEVPTEDRQVEWFGSVEELELLKGV